MRNHAVMPVNLSVAENAVAAQRGLLIRDKDHPGEKHEYHESCRRLFFVILQALNAHIFFRIKNKQTDISAGETG